MLHDAKVEVTCDGASCMDSVQIEPEYVYRDYSGKSGYYDTSDDAIEEKLERKGWTVADGKHYCEGCKPETEEPEDEE